jgi:hypothetical protein
MRCSSKWTDWYLAVVVRLYLIGAMTFVVYRRDMSVIVEKQGKSIDDIAVAADMSHDRAKAGLQQVNQAAEYQPGCVLC